MSRTATVSTIVASIVAFSSPALAASDEELAHSSDLMVGAFRCAIYAHLFNDLKEQQRLFQIGLKAGRDLVEGMENPNQPPMSEGAKYMTGATNNFLVGSIEYSETAKAYGEIPSEQRFHPSEDNTPAKAKYRESNCSLIK